MTDSDLNVEVEGQVLIAALSGEIDIANADELRIKITEAVPNSALGVVVDLTDVTYLDSSGVRLVFELADRLTSRQQVLRLVAPANAPVRRVLNVVDPDGSVPVIAARADAVEQVNASG